jgi:hypothetical protein
MVRIKKLKFSDFLFKIGNTIVQEAHQYGDIGRLTSFYVRFVQSSTLGIISGFSAINSPHRQGENRYIQFVICVLLVFNMSAQPADTINTNNLKLNTKFLKESKSTYAVYMTDTNNVRRGAAHLWDRRLSFSKDKNGDDFYNFEWSWYMKDTLISFVTATGNVRSMKPLTHNADYFKRGKKSFVFNNEIVTVPDEDKKNKKDSSFQVVLNAPAFEFPMDLELYALLPFKNIGQKFVMAFYEPGQLKSSYYDLVVAGIKDLQMPGGAMVKCWLLRVDYGMKGSSAVFWIGDRSREVLKVDEDFPGGKSYKVKLY